MRDVAVVAYCRTGIAKARRGAPNQTHGVPMTAHVLRHAVKQAGIVTLDRDEDPRPDTTLEALAALEPVYLERP